MSRTLRVRYLRNGALADADAVVLRDPTNTFGVQRTDSGATVVAAGTAMPRVSLGVYEYGLTEPAPNLTYRFYPEITKGTSVSRPESFSYPPAADGAYQNVNDADTLAATLPGLASYKGTAAADARQAALNFAGRRIDARRYQGRKFDPRQPHQFPRVAYESGLTNVPAQSAAIDANYARSVGAQIWDWDDDAKTAIVPANVLLAELYEADSILNADRDRVLNAIHSGLSAQSVGGLSESYNAAMLAAGVAGELCRDAAALLFQYRLVSGRLL